MTALPQAGPVPSLEIRPQDQLSSGFTPANKSEPGQARNAIHDANRCITGAEEEGNNGVDELEQGSAGPGPIHSLEGAPFGSRDEGVRVLGNTEIKRPRSSELSYPSAPPRSHKIRRIGQPQSHDDSTIADTNSLHTVGQTYVDLPRTIAEDQQQRYANAQMWQQKREGSVASEVHLAEALQQEGHHYIRSESGHGSPAQDYHFAIPNTSQSGSAPPQKTSSMTATMLQKQRKRTFSSRTKTGCLTCRDRKKKCDEAKPLCKNCVRGGFRCKGYAQPNGVLKASVPQDQLQAKNEIYKSVSSDAFPDSSLGARSTFYATLAHEDLEADTEQPLLSSFSPERVSPHSHAGPQTHVSNISSTYGSADWRSQQTPSILQSPIKPGQSFAQSIGNSKHPVKNIPHPGPPASLLRPPHQRSSSQAHLFMDQRMTAQLALDHHSSRPMPHVRGVYRTEKEKMLNCVPFQSSDPQLKQEREDCAFKVFAFNRGIREPDIHSGSTRLEQFRNIIELHTVESSTAPDASNITMLLANTNGKSNSPTYDHATAPPSPFTPFGHLGVNVEVQPPFHCDYGYNIHIADDVEVGRDCYIKDAATVFIGARTIISADVKFVTEEADFEGSLAQAGEKRLLRGRRIVIGEDCYIGPGVSIKPGTILDRGTVVVAPSPVQKPLNAPVLSVPSMPSMPPLTNQDWVQSFR